MSTIKLLEGEERVQALALDGFVIPVAEDTLVLGAVEDGRVIARVILLQMLHLEGTWIAPDRRGGGILARRLVKAAEEMIVKCGATHAMAYTPEADPKIGEYMQWLGYTRFPVTVWAKQVKE